MTGYLELISLRCVFDLPGEVPLSLVSVRLKSKLLPVTIPVIPFSSNYPFLVLDYSFYSFLDSLSFSYCINGFYLGIT